MARRLIPLLDRVLVEKVVAPTKSAGGVLLPESAVPKVCSAVTAAAAVFSFCGFFFLYGSSLSVILSCGMIIQLHGRVMRPCYSS